MRAHIVTTNHAAAIDPAMEEEPALLSVTLSQAKRAHMALGGQGSQRPGRSQPTGTICRMLFAGLGMKSTSDVRVRVILCAPCETGIPAAVRKS